MDLELAVLARDVGPRVPGVGEGVERLVGQLGDLFVPDLLGVGSRFDSAQTLFAQIAHAVADPLRLALGAERHIVQH